MDRQLFTRLPKMTSLGRYLAQLFNAFAPIKLISKDAATEEAK